MRLRLLALVLPSAAAPAAFAQMPFTEEAAERGVSYFVFQGSASVAFGTGLAFVDLDQDGDPDLVTTGASDGFPGIFENDGTGNFTARGPGGLPAMSNTSGVSAGDFDGDGLPDLYFTNALSANVLARNIGEFQFANVSLVAGVADPGAGMGSAWGDYNGDGYLDLYVANRTGTQSDPNENRLYKNQGNGTFVEVAASLGVVDPGGLTFQPIWFDMDRDGDADLYLSTDKGYTNGQENHLYRNDGGLMTEITTAVTEANFDSMGVAVGDIDGNGLFDLYCTNTPGGNGLFMQLNPGTFIDGTNLADVAVNELGWGTMFLDVDNNGTQDLYVVNEITYDTLFIHDGSFPCRDLAPEYGMTGAVNSFCCAKADVDLDGDIDIATSSWLQPLRLFINHEGSQRSWTRLTVAGKGANKQAVGALVDVVSAGVLQIGEVMAGQNYKSQNELPLHFGLGEARLIDEIRVRWPDGETRVLRHMPAGEAWTLYPDEQLGDADGDGEITFDDLQAFGDFWTGPGSGNLRPGGERLDMDGDGDVDGQDMRAFIYRFDDYQPESPEPRF